ncbi:hypothetical protein AGOR_G00058210 [Albula goreensis]|uniref:Coiled-coil domain-containing protein 108 n=1 Tax=Albula goreensis TaxID=1534307 RepID=A0A8T3DTH8_9TELE|nr:hypothetical protein AGOR_G00058210 [Albula goreensis]
MSRRSGELQRRGASQRSCFLGVETWAELVWDSWELGREFTMALQLKNVHGKLQKLRFRPPASQVFSMPFSHVITLSPGTTGSLPVTFRPLERREYSDCIEFHSSMGTFRVSLRATLPCHALVVPESVLVPPCAVLDSSHAPFQLRNSSKLRTHFLWEVNAPFQLCPVSGALEPGEECTVTVMFRPQGALVYQEQASCLFGEKGESRCGVLIRGLAKYPHLQLCGVEQEAGGSVLDFGCVPVGQTLERHFHIYNPTPVSTSYRLARVGRAPLGTVDCSSIEYLSLTCQGGVSKTLLKLRGTCSGPEVSLSATVVDFGCVPLGGEAWRTVEISNSAAAEACFQFDTDATGHSVFTVTPPCGTLPGNSRLTLRVRFCPQHPIPHHRRAPCLLLHRDPLFLDMIGTCHSEQQKPAILKPEHLDRYHLHLARGLTCYPPDILSAMLAEGKMQLDQEGALTLAEAVLERPPVADCALPESTPMEEYFWGCGAVALDIPMKTGVSSHVTVDPPELLFQDEARSLPLSITNHTKGRLTLVWTSAPDSPFSISPTSCELSPLKSTSFRVTYTPTQPNTLHGAQLECFAFYKMLRDHRQVDERTLCPSWCVTVRVSGHSFQPGRQHFTPASLCSALWCGLVPPESHQILMLRGVPQDNQSRTLELPLSLQLNASPKHTQVLTVVSAVEQPRVALEGDGSLFFRPTAVGSSSTRSQMLKNTSRLPLHFCWQITSPDGRVLRHPTREWHPTAQRGPGEAVHCGSRHGEKDSDKDPVVLRLESHRGTVPARSRMVMRSTVRLPRRAQYCWTISYQILSSSGSELSGLQYLCQVKVEGVYPVLQVTDIRGSGGAEDLSKLQLWGLFSVDALNSYLRRDPTPPELTHRVPPEDSLPPSFSPVLLDFNFSAAPLGSDPSAVLMVLENPGSIPVDWALLFPEDQQLELECWAESMDFSPSDLQHMKVQDHRLFTASPRSGTLQPGQQRAVQLTHRHAFAGTDLLPVLLKLSHGRAILLNFVGVTVERDRPYVHFASSSHTFTPVAIGGFNPPKQVYELYNGGVVPVRYHIDTAPLEQLKEDNFGHPVLQCLTPVERYTLATRPTWSGSSPPSRRKHTAWTSRCTCWRGTLRWCGSWGVAGTVAQRERPLHPTSNLCPAPRGCPYLDSWCSCRRSGFPWEIYLSVPETHASSSSPMCLTMRECSTPGTCPPTTASRSRWFQAVGSWLQERALSAHFTLHTSGCPSFYLLDLTCQVTAERAVLRYEQDLRQWEEEREKQREEFTITEGGAQPSHSPLESSTQTLPPIRSSSTALVGVTCARPSRAERRAQREAEQVWRKPEPPRPTLLHLGVTARSHSPQEFQSCFPSRFSTHYLQRAGQPTSPCRPQCRDSALLRHESEREIITHVVSSILRSLLDDPQFHQSLVETSADPDTLSDSKLHHEGLKESEQEQHLSVQSAIRRSPEFADLVEDVLLNTLQNLMTEAFLGELLLTARPRTIALPPSSPRKSPRSSSRRPSRELQIP